MVGIISVVIGGHFGGGDHFDGGDHFGGGTASANLLLKFLKRLPLGLITEDGPSGNRALSGTTLFFMQCLYTAFEKGCRDRGAR